MVVRFAQDHRRRLAVLLFFACYVASAAYAVVHPPISIRGTMWFLDFIVPLSLAAAPLLIWLALRMPLVFPFGAYVVLVPFDAVLLVSGGGATITRMVAIAACGMLILGILLTRELCRPGRSWYAWAAAMAWTTLSLFWDVDQSSGHDIWTIQFQLFLVMTLLAVYRPKPREFAGMLALIVCSGVLATIYMVYQLHHGHSFTTDRVTIVTDSGAAVDPNALSTSYLLPIGIALTALLSSRSGWIRLLSALALPVMIAGVFLTGSRGGLLALLATLAWLAWRSRYRVQMGLLTILAVAMSAFSPTVWARFAKDPSQQGSGSGRTDIWATGLHAVRDHWFAGQGVGSFGAVYNREMFSVYQAAFQGWGRPSHSIVVGTLVELGVIGLALVLFAWYASFRQLRVITPASANYPLRLAFEATLIGLFVQALFLDVYFIKYFWLAHSLVLSLTNLEQPSVIDVASRGPTDEGIPHVPMPRISATVG